jgi:hypothetical protein
MLVKNPSVILFPYLLLILVGLIIPSDGEHGFFSIKSLSFLGSFTFLSAYIFLKQKTTIYELKLLCFLLFSIAFLAFWLLVSSIHDQTTGVSQIDQLKLFLITLIFPLSSIYIIQEKLLSFDQFLKAVLYSSFLYISIKIILIVLHLCQLVDIWTLLSLAGIRYMRMSIYGNLERIQTSVDIATPFLVFFVLQAERLGLKLSRGFRYGYVFLGLLSTFFSFSRYLIFIYMISCFLYFITLTPRKIIKTLLLLVGSAGVAYIALGADEINQVIERRVFSSENFKSDDTRSLQIQSLLLEHEQYSFIGKGMGAYAEDNIRDPVLLHSYEVQWMAFLMQFGLIGLILLGIPLGFIVYGFVHAPITRVKCAFLCLFLLWLLSGFTNPFLISLTSGIIYAVFFLSGKKLSETVLARSFV